MATIARIKCGSCGQRFDYYFDLRKPGDDYVCPYCLAVMDRETAHVFRGVMGRFADLNAEMRRYADDRGETPYQFDLLEITENMSKITSDILYKNKKGAYYYE